MFAAGTEVDVLRHRADGDDALLLAVLGAEYDAVANGGPGRAALHRPAVHAHLTGRRQDCAAQQTHELGASGADEAEEAGDLAAGHAEGHRFPQARPGQTADLQPAGRVSTRPVVVDVREFAADHAPDQRVARHPGQRIVRDDVPAVAQHRGGVAELKDLVQAVGDVEDGVSVNKLSDELIAYGMQEINNLLENFNRCVLEDAWMQSYEFYSSRADGAYEFELPKYLNI